MNQQPNSEKNPLDELFARKLGNLQRPPKPDSFARLQQRMQGGAEKPRMAVWRNVNWQVAAAACIAVAFMLGWLYSNQLGNTTVSSTQAVAVREKRGEQPDGSGKTAVERTTKSQLPPLAQVDKESMPKQRQAGKANQSTDHTAGSAISKRDVDGQVTLAQKAIPITTTSSTEKSALETVAAAKTVHPPQVAPTERVLVVTIEEPEAMVAARQTAASVVNNMPVLAASPSKEGKATFWQQVKRLKQDDDVARQAGADDESGLLNRAYKGIKQRLEKDKQAKQ